MDDWLYIADLILIQPLILNGSKIAHVIHTKPTEIAMMWLPQRINTTGGELGRCGGAAHLVKFQRKILSRFKRANLFKNIACLIM